MTKNKVTPTKSKQSSTRIIYPPKKKPLTKAQESLKTFPRSQVFNAVEAILRFPDLKSVTMFCLDQKQRVRASKIRDGEYRLTLGRPNYAERAHQAKCKKDPQLNRLVLLSYIKKISKNKKSSHL